VIAMIVSSKQASPTVALLASSYLDGAPTVPTPFELASFKTWIHSEFDAIPCQVKFWTGDISLAECKAAFAKHGTLNISTAHNSHPYLTASQNARFRAIHDWHHIIVGADDGLSGELATYLYAENRAPKSIQWMLFSEIALQAAAAIHTGKFPAQKLVKYSGFI
jgi:hypothetical protein